MKNNYFLLLIGFILFSNLINAQGGLCEELTPLSFENGFVLIENCYNGNQDCEVNAEQGPAYGCLGSQPFPAWFSGEVTNPGDINFTISENTEFNSNGEPVGSPLDVDFIIWGPFSEDQNVCDYANLNNDAIVDCSFSAANIEDAIIPNTQVGEIYVILITNFNQLEGFIFIDQTGGDGQLGGDGIPQNVQACEGDTVVLDASNLDGVSYEWQIFDNGVFVTIPGENTATLTVNQSGLYQVQAVLVDNTMVSQDYLVEFIPLPQIPVDVVSIEVFDLDNDGFENFNITVAYPDILGDQNPGDFEISVYLTLSDATANTNPLSDPTSFVNSTNPQTVWFRITNLITGCFNTGEIQLILLAGVDTDGDGVADPIEDLNGNGNLEDDDTDGDGTPNYLDDDDDGDNVSTADETTGIGAGFQFEIIDTDQDTIENYLDDDDDGDLILTIDEDYNNNGTPLDDDTNGNGIPDFLDAEVALSIEDILQNSLSIYPNPASSHVSINLGDAINTVSVHVVDALGKKVIANAQYRTGETIQVAHLSAGMYFLDIQSGASHILKKFIKQ